MFCQQCQKQSPNTAKFCIHCGARLVKPAHVTPKKVYDPEPPVSLPATPRKKVADDTNWASISNGLSKLQSTPQQKAIDNDKLVKKSEPKPIESALPVPAEGTQLRVKQGREAGMVFPITSSSVEFKFQTDAELSPRPQFAIEKTASGYAVRPLPHANLIYVNGNLTRYTQHLSHGDEISVPPYITYTIEIEPEPVPTGKRTGWIVLIILQQLLSGAVALIMGLVIINRAGSPETGVFLLMTGVALLVGVVGLWQMREWGRWITIVIRVIDIIVGLAAPPVNFMAMGINLAVIIYLARSSTGSRFR